MDGIAVRSRETFGAREDEPLHLVKDRDFVWVNTGNPLPEGMDAVIMVENVIESGDDLLIEAPAFPWQNVRRIGEDIVATELVMPRNHVLSGFDLAALLTGGIFDVDVYETIRMRIIPTGDEVLDFTRRPKPRPGEVIESNSVMLSSMAIQRGIAAERVPPVADSMEAIEAAVRKALDEGMHVVVIGAGSSAGSKDFTRAVMERVGQVIVHGVAAMPGKPSLLGVAENGALLVGAPGYPVSSMICFEKLVLPLCDWLVRRTDFQRETLPVVLTRSVPSKLGREEFIRLAIGRAGKAWVATPLGRGAGMISTLTKAQGMSCIPANSEGGGSGQDRECRTVRSAAYPGTDPHLRGQPRQHPGPAGRRTHGPGGQRKQGHGHPAGIHPCGVHGRHHGAQERLGHVRGGAFVRPGKRGFQLSLSQEICP